MTRRVVWIIVVAACAVAVSAWLLLKPPPPPPNEENEVAPRPTATPAPEQRIVLLFPGGDGLLHPELRVVRLPADAVDRVKMVMSELLAGSQEELQPVVPYQAELLGVFIDVDGNAYVDITAPPEPLTGSLSELLLAYGIVDSVLLNSPDLRAVQILFGGTEVTTLSGHLDLSKPLRLNKDFIEAS